MNVLFVYVYNLKKHVSKFINICTQTNSKKNINYW